MRVYQGSIINAKRIRKNIIEMCYKTKTASLGSSLSCVEILISVYKNITFFDRFILSKGHATAGLYAVLEEFGYFGSAGSDILKTYCKEGSELSVHVQRWPELVDWSTGSLGHGLPVSCGMAKAGRRVVVVLSDGERDDGSKWEAISFGV